MKQRTGTSYHVTRLLIIAITATAVWCKTVSNGTMWIEDTTNKNQEFSNPLELRKDFDSSLGCIAYCNIRSGCEGVTVKPEDGGLSCSFYGSLTGAVESSGSKFWKQKASEARTVTCIHTSYNIDPVFQSCLFFRNMEFNNWQNANTKCKADGAELAIVDTLAKINAISSKAYVWIGGLRKNGKWEWHNGEPVDMDPNLWATGQPSGKATETCLFVLPSGLDDNNCVTPAASLCEYTG